MSLDALSPTSRLISFAPPVAVVCLGPGVAHDDLDGAVSTFVGELWEQLDAPDWSEWFSAADPVVEVAIDDDEDDAFRVYGPGDPDAPATSDFDLARAPRAPHATAPAAARTFHVLPGSSAQMLTEALQQAVDLLLSYAEDAPEVIEEWVTAGAPCRVVEL